MAALTVADELSEISVRVKRLEEELAAGKSARVAAAERTKDAEAAVATALEAAADRIESLAKKINRTIGGNPRSAGLAADQHLPFKTASRCSLAHGSMIFSENRCPLFGIML